MGNDQTQKNAQSTRFAVKLSTPQGGVLEKQGFDDPQSAMTAFASMAKNDFGKVHGIGSYVALTDNELKLDASRLADTISTYRLQFGKAEGRAAYQATLATLAA